MRKRLINALSANIFAQFTTIFIQLVSVPLFLNFWGVELYGEWLILSTIPTYFAISDIGFAKVAANEMTMEVAKGNQKHSLEIFQSIWVFITIISCVLFLCILPIIWFIPIENYLNLKNQTHLQVFYIITIFTLYVLVNLQEGLLDAGFKANGKFGFWVIIYNIVRILENTAIFLVVFSGGKLIASACAFFGVRFLSFFCMKYLMQKNAPWISYGFKHVKIDIIKRLANPAIAFMGFPLSYALINQGLTTVVAMMLNPTSVVAFSTLRTISRLAFQLIVVINSTIWPEMSAAFGSGNLSLARKLHRYSCKASMWLSGLSILILAFLGQYLLKIWTGDRVNMDYPAFSSMLVVIAANSIWLTSSVVPSSTNQHQRISLYFVLSSIGCLMTGVLLTPFLGITGASISMLVSDVVMIVFVLKTSFTLLNENEKDFFIELFRLPSLKPYI
jgi:O-antigen/teichoic acid export membrane protein